MFTYILHESNKLFKTKNSFLTFCKMTDLIKPVFVHMNAKTQTMNFR